MNKGALAAIIVGSIVLTIGSAILVGCLVANNTKNSNIITKEYEVEQFHNIEIDLDEADLEFVATTDGTRKVVCEERKKQYHEVKVEGDTLHIEGFNYTKWYEHIFSIGKSMKVTVYAPAQLFNEANIDSSTGNITIPNDFTFSKLNVVLSTGNMNINTIVTDDASFVASTGNVNLEINAVNLDVKTTTGNIKVKGQVTNDAKVQASTGKVNLELKSHNLDVTTSTGKINLTNTVVEDHLEIHASTGDVKLVDSDANTINIETSTGDVDAVLLTGKTFDVETNTGKVKRPESTPGAGLCKVRTSTGDVTISIK